MYKEISIHFIYNSDIMVSFEWLNFPDARLVSWER